MLRWIKRAGFSVLLLCAVGLALFLMFRGKYRTVIQNLAKTQVMNSTSDLTNDAISRQIEEGSIRYDRIVFFEKDVNGKITALKTNIGEINRLKTDILGIINEEILALDTSDIGIPLGSLILPELLSGKGPVIPVRILSIRNSDATFSSDFSQAGINQTIHRLFLRVHAVVCLSMAKTQEQKELTYEVCIAETVIVGTVPQMYANLGE